jgi:hypothetical protein
MTLLALGLFGGKIKIIWNMEIKSTAAGWCGVRFKARTVVRPRCAIPTKQSNKRSNNTNTN